MPWFVYLAVVAVILGGTPLAVDFFRRWGVPRLSLRIPRLDIRSSVPDELCLRLAKTITEGGFERSRFGKKPFVDLFPTKKTCPHCRDKDRRVWDLARAERLLTNIGKLAREIKRGQFCLSCLGQLSEIAEVRKQLKELGKKDPRSLRRPSRRGCLLLFIGVWVTPTICMLMLLVLKFIFGY